MIPFVRRIHLKLVGAERSRRIRRLDAQIAPTDPAIDHCAARQGRVEKQHIAAYANALLPGIKSSTFCDFIPHRAQAFRRI